MNLAVLNKNLLGSSQPLGDWVKAFVLVSCTWCMYCHKQHVCPPWQSQSSLQKYRYPITGNSFIRPILWDPGQLVGAGKSLNRQEKIRQRKVKKAKTFLCPNFFLSTNCPWVSEDVIWPAVRMILPTWFDHLQESFLYKEVQFKNVLLACEKELLLFSC